MRAALALYLIGFGGWMLSGLTGAPVDITLDFLPRDGYEEVATIYRRFGL